MTNAQREALRKAIIEHGRVNSETVEAARAYLIRMGFVDENMRTTPEYGGEPREDAAGGR